MDTFTLRVLADVVAGRVYIDGLDNVRVDPEVRLDPTDEPRYIEIVRDLRRALSEDGRSGVGMRRLRLTAPPGGFESATALRYVAGAFEAVDR